jgi:RNA polymerase sigma factor (sigma-70 family)
MESLPREVSELLERSGWAWRLARALTRDETEADDALGETRLAVARTGIEFGELAQARAWIARVLRNAVIHARRSDVRRTAREHRVARDEALPAAERVLEREESRRAVVVALLALPEPYRGTLIAHYYDGLKPSAIASREGAPPSTVRNRLARGRALLRRELERGGGREPRDWFAVVAPLLSQPEGVVLGGIALGSKTVVAVAGVAFVTLLGSLAWRFAGESRRDTAVELVAAAEVEPVTPSENSKGTPFDSPNQLATSPQRAAVVEAPTTAPKGVRVRAVDAAGAALPGAQIAWRDAAGLTEYWRAYYAGEAPDLEAWIAGIGFTERADAAGELTVPFANRPVAVSGRSGELWAWAHVATDNEPVVLTLVPAHSVVFEVVDRRGAPVAGAPVGLQMARGFNASGIAWRGWTGADGRVRLPNLEHAIRQGYDSTYLPYASVLGPLGIDRVALDPANPPDGPVRFVLPAFGALRVELKLPPDAHGASDFWVSAVEVGASRSSAPPVRGFEYRQLAKPVNGRAEVLWTHVGIGVELLVEVGSNALWRSASLDVNGPSREGEEVQAVLELESGGSRIAGRLVDSEGSPVTGRQAWMWMRELDAPPTRDEALKHVVVDADGRFRSLVDAHFADTPCSWRLTLEDGSARGVDAPARTVVPLVDGVLELGDVVLEELPRFVAGRAVHADGTPAREVEVSVARWTRTGGEGSREFWDWTNSVAASDTDNSGHFVLFGDPPAGRYAISARVGEFGFGEFVPFERGADDVEIVLPDFGGLAGRLLLSDGVDPAALRIELALEPGSGLDLDAWLAPRSDGAFEFQRLPVGMYRIAIRRVWDEEQPPVLEVPAIRVTEGQMSRDERLAALDLRDSLHALEVQIVDSNGEPVRDGHVALSSHGAADNRSARVRFERGRVRLCGLGAASDVEVAAPGFRTARRENVRGIVRVELERGLEVLVQVPAELDLAPGAPELHLGFWHIDFSRNRPETVFDVSGRSVGQWGGAPQVELRLDGSRKLEVPLPQHGKWDLALILKGDDAKGAARSQGVRLNAARGRFQLPQDGSRVEVRLEPDLEHLSQVLSDFSKD